MTLHQNIENNYRFYIHTVSPRGNAVSVGGADSSVALAQVTTEWPDTWSRTHSGTYHADVAVDLASLSGAGVWKVFIMNAWSLSERVEYDITVRMKFQGLPPSKTGGSCGPTLSPTPFETALPTVSMGPTPSPTKIAEGSAQYVIPIHKVALGVHDDGKALVQDHIELHKFSFSGVLTSIEINLDPYIDGYETRGTNAWLLAVAVTDPSGLVAQVGGSSWRKQQNNFYSRNWPDPWLGKMSDGRPWVGSRDVHAAGLLNFSVPMEMGSTVDHNDDHPSSDNVLEKDAYYENFESTEQDDSYYSGDDQYYSNHHDKSKAHISANLMSIEPPGLWSVEIAMGYPWTIRAPVNFSGAVILHFKKTIVTGVVLAYPFSLSSFKYSFNTSNNSSAAIETTADSVSLPISSGSSDPPTGDNDNFNIPPKRDEDGSSMNNPDDTNSANNDAADKHNSPSNIPYQGPFHDDTDMRAPIKSEQGKISDDGGPFKSVSGDNLSPAQNSSVPLRHTIKPFLRTNIIGWSSVVGIILLVVSFILFTLFRRILYKKSENSEQESVGLISVQMSDSARKFNGDELFQTYNNKIQMQSQQKPDRSTCIPLSAPKYGSIDIVA